MNMVQMERHQLPAPIKVVLKTELTVGNFALTAIAEKLRKSRRLIQKQQKMKHSTSSNTTSNTA